MVKGKKDYRDLSTTAQYYYEKLVGFLNKFNQWPFNEDVVEAIEWLDKIIDLVKDDMIDYYDSKISEINQLLDKANSWIDDLENKIEEF